MDPTLNLKVSSPRLQGTRMDELYLSRSDDTDTSVATGIYIFIILALYVVCIATLMKHQPPLLPLHVPGPLRQL
jgi:hypothetical protein